MNRPIRSRLLMLELVLNLVIFALCAAVCVVLLVQARSMGRESTALTQAVYLAQSAAESYRAGEGNPGWSLPDENGFTGRLEQHGGTFDVYLYQDGRLVYALEGVAGP